MLGPRSIWLAIFLVVLASGARAQWEVVDLHPTGAVGANSYAWNVSGGQQVGHVTLDSAHATLWSGSAVSWIDLQPIVATSSSARGVDGNQQVGWAHVGGSDRASMWSGTAASWTDLTPPWASAAYAYSVSGGEQVGWTSINGKNQACLWKGTVSSWVDLHPVGASDSIALGVNGGHQVGYATVGSARASLWGGTAASWVNLHPAGASYSKAWGVSAAQQVGWARVGNSDRASLWSGTAASWVDLTPVAATDSMALGVADGQQVGSARVGGSDRASLWSGTAASWVDLHAFLPANFYLSVAYGISHAGGFTYVTGYGYNATSGRYEALMWVTHVTHTLQVQSWTPSSGVTMTVYSPDINGRTNGATPFARVYDSFGTYSITAPAFVGGKVFDHWNKDGAPVAMAKTLAVLMDAPHTILAVYTTPYVLTVNSTNPASGVPMTVYQADVNNLRNGTTSFTRTYKAGSSVSLTAPSTAGGNGFSRWEKDGANMGSARTLALPMNYHHTVNAIYAPLRTLTVSSINPGSGVAITVWTRDFNGLRNGTTAFTRTYLDGKVASLTAPSTISGMHFVHWLRNGVAQGPSRTISIEMIADNAVSAVYGL